MGSWGKIGSKGSIGKVGIGKGSIGKGSGIGGESSSGDDGSGLDACGWLGICKVGSKDLRCMDRGVHFITRVGMSEGRSSKSNNGSNGKTRLGGL